MDKLRKIEALKSACNRLSMLPLYVTSGEPAGIGPDICLSLASRVDERPIVVLADRDLLCQRAAMLNLNIELIAYTGQQHSSAVGQLYIDFVASDLPNCDAMGYT